MVMDTDSLMLALPKLIPEAMGLKITAEVTEPGVAVSAEGASQAGAIMLAYILASISANFYAGLAMAALEIGEEFTLQEWCQTVDQLTSVTIKKIRDGDVS